MHDVWLTAYAATSYSPDQTKPLRLPWPTVALRASSVVKMRRCHKQDFGPPHSQPYGRHKPSTANRPIPHPFHMDIVRVVYGRSPPTGPTQSCPPTTANG